MIYVGVGSRQTPFDICEVMTEIARRRHDAGWILRSGGALGADRAFEAGAGDLKEIYLPWGDIPLQEAMEFTRHYHPKWSACSPVARAMHARNAFQVMGVDLATPADYLICWTPEGKVTGGTGQAMRIALAHDIPILNLFYESQMIEALKL